MSTISEGFSYWKKVAGGNCKVAGALSHRDNGSLVKWEEQPPLPHSAERNGSFPQKILKIRMPCLNEVYSHVFFAPLTDFVERQVNKQGFVLKNFVKLVAFKVLQKWHGMPIHLHEYSTYYIIVSFDFLYFQLKCNIKRNCNTITFQSIV